jgi:hypothetical protein
MLTSTLTFRSFRWNSYSDFETSFQCLTSIWPSRHFKMYFVMTQDALCPISKLSALFSPATHQLKQLCQFLFPILKQSIKQNEKILQLGGRRSDSCIEPVSIEKSNKYWMIRQMMMITHRRVYIDQQKGGCLFKSFFDNPLCLIQLATSLSSACFYLPLSEQFSNLGHRTTIQSINERTFFYLYIYINVCSSLLRSINRHSNNFHLSLFNRNWWATNAHHFSAIDWEKHYGKRTRIANWVSNRILMSWMASRAHRIQKYKRKKREELPGNVRNTWNDQWIRSQWRQQFCGWDLGTN